MTQVTMMGNPIGSKRQLSPKRRESDCTYAHQ